MKYKTFALIRKIVIVILLVFAIFWLFSSVCGKSNKSVKNIPQSVKNPDPVKPVYGSATMVITDTDKDVFKYQKSDITSGKIDDQGDSYKKFINSANYKIDLRCDFKKGYSFWNRIKVDFDKDGKWDEKWWFQKNGEIRKEVSSDDNEVYEYKYFLKGDVWEKR